MRRIVLACALLLGLPLAAAAMDVTADPATIKWGPPPPGLPPGAQVAVISGDPGSNGPYVVRAKLPRGYTIAPHTHPTEENVTVLSGSMRFGMGDKLHKKKATVVRAGGFFRAEQGMQHYAFTSRGAVIQVHGMGPFAITYVNAADDPRNKPTAQASPAADKKK
jgi:quercetin dioxygenase-like cupin family protein